MENLYNKEVNKTLSFLALVPQKTGCSVAKSASFTVFTTRELLTHLYFFELVLQKVTKKQNSVTKTTDSVKL